MIALPGLALTTGRVDVARSILRVFAGAMSDGMIPNRFLDSGDLAEGAKVEYNTIDGTLWMFEATRALLAKTGDAEFVREHIYPALKEALAWHIKGARHHIHMDEDGLLSGGEEEPTHVDGRQGEQLGGHPALRQAGGDSGVVV